MGRKGKEHCPLGICHCNRGERIILACLVGILGNLEYSNDAPAPCLCAVIIWLSSYMLVTKNYTIYELVYFMGLGGAMQAVLTPADAAAYNFPHFRIMQTFIAHGLLINIAIYMTVVEGFRPTLQSFKRVFIWTNIYMVVIFFVNLAIGSNYLFIAYKPKTSPPCWICFLPGPGTFLNWRQSGSRSSSFFTFHSSSRIGAPNDNYLLFLDDCSFMIFATISTHRPPLQPVLVSNDRVHPLPFAHMCSVSLQVSVRKN